MKNKNNTIINILKRLELHLEEDDINEIVDKITTYLKVKRKSNKKRKKLKKKCPKMKKN
jgi:hypothetical protein